MQLGDITPLIIEYKYWILLPLSFAEGPIVAFIAGTLSAAGYFNIYLLGIFFLVRDLVVDLGCYYLGHFGGKWPWVQRLLARMGVTQDHLDDVSALWNKHPAKTMFFSKLSYGVAAGFIVVAGMVNMRLRSFLLYGLLITLMHYGVLLVVGYFFGQSFGGQITTIIERVPYIIGAASLFFIAYYFFKRYTKRKLEAMEKQEEIYGNK